MEDERRPCESCSALNGPAAAYCWQCQASLQVLAGSGSIQRGGLRSASVPGAISGPTHLASTSGSPKPSPVRWAVVVVVIAAVAAGGWVLSRPKAVSLPEQLDGASRTRYEERNEPAPFDDHPPARVLMGAYGSDPADPGSFGIVVWVIEDGYPNGAGTGQILTVALPEGLTVDTTRGVSASVDGASFECVPATSIQRTVCAWNGGRVDGLIGTGELDLDAALLQAERIRTEIGA